MIEHNSNMEDMYIGNVYRDMDSVLWKITNIYGYDYEDGEVHLYTDETDEYKYMTKAVVLNIFKEGIKNNKYVHVATDLMYYLPVRPGDIIVDNGYAYFIESLMGDGERIEVYTYKGDENLGLSFEPYMAFNDIFNRLPEMYKNYKMHDELTKWL